MSIEIVSRALLRFSCITGQTIVFLVIVHALPARTWALQSKEHRTISAEVAGTFGFSPEAVQLMGQAATEPDLYDWNTAAAHAQTPNDESGKPSMTARAAEQQSEAYLRSQALSMRRELNANNVGNALYILGYALHTIQDYAAHLGMTDADHAFLANWKGHNPDLQPKSIELAREWTSEFFMAARDSLGPCDWEKLRLFTVRTGPGDHWREMPGVVAKRETDFADYGAYEALSGQFESIPEPQRSVRWLPYSLVHHSLIESFVGFLKDSSNDRSRLFVGEWLQTYSDGRTATVSITPIQPDVFSFYRKGSQKTWRMTASNVSLRGAVPVTKEDMTDTPDIVFAQAAAQLRSYLTLTLSESHDCKIVVQYEQDSIRWEMVRPSDGGAPHRTGRYQIRQKAPEESWSATLKRIKN